MSWFQASVMLVEVTLESLLMYLVKSVFWVLLFPVRRVPILMD